MHQNTPLAFPGGRTASTSLPSSNQPTYADTLSSAVISNKTKREDQRSQVDQTRHARPTTDARTAAPTPQSNSTPGLPQKRHLAVQRIPKKTQRRERANVPFLSKLVITLSIFEERSNHQRRDQRRDGRNNYRRQTRNYSHSKKKKATRKRNNSAPVTQPPF